MSSQTTKIANATTLAGWRDAVNEYFGLSTMAIESENSISVALRSARTISELKNNFAYLATVLSESEGARKAMTTFTPDSMDRTELEHYFMCLWHFPQEVLLTMEQRLFADLESAISSGKQDYIRLTSIAVTKLGTPVAAKRIAKFMLDYKNPGTVLDGPTLTHFLGMGEVAQEALLGEIHSNLYSDQTDRVVHVIIDMHSTSNWEPFTSRMSITILKQLLEGDLKIAARALSLLFLFPSEKRRLIPTLGSLAERVGKNDEAMELLVRNAILYAKSP